MKKLDFTRDEYLDAKSTEICAGGQLKYLSMSTEMNSTPVVN